MSDQNQIWMNGTDHSDLGWYWYVLMSEPEPKLKRGQSHSDLPRTKPISVQGLNLNDTVRWACKEYPSKRIVRIGRFG